MAASGNDLRVAAQQARECAVIGQAVTLARWIGDGRRPLTPGRVLRKADVPAAGAALGVDVPAKLRTMADLPALHRPWCAAVAAGLVQIGDGWVAAGPALAGWPPGDEDLLAGWVAGLRAVCAAESDPRAEDGVRMLAMALLTVLGKDRVPRKDRLWPAVTETLKVLCRRYDMDWFDQQYAANRHIEDPHGWNPLPWLVALLAEFGAVAGDPLITPLGRWAAVHLADGLAGRADPGLTAGEMIAAASAFGDEEQRLYVARGWLAGREPAEAAREILTAAEGMSPPLRLIAIDVVAALGDDALPAWREMAAAPRVGPRARAVLASLDEGPEPSEADWAWLGVEAAAAALAKAGPDEALTCIWETMPGPDLEARMAAARATGHPDAEPLTQAVAEFAASGAPRSIDQVAQLKISLTGFRPAIWRRVRLPVTATLADLHVVIQVLFGWDGDHLHLFQLGKKQYASRFVYLEQTEDESEVRVGDAVAAGRKFTYTYDLGAEWHHEIIPEKVLPRDHSQVYPVCVAFRGDSPVEYWSEDDLEDDAEDDREDFEEPEPFDLTEVNRRLAALTGGMS
jgi:hypothetical protein